MIMNLERRPRKEGYLKIQINSTFNIWNTRYFYLDGYNLAYFWDENTDKPTQVVDLEGCVIDGLWPNSDLYTFTIRSLNNDDDIYYLVTKFLLIKFKGAYSEAEAYDWLKNLQAAVKLIEYEKMTEKLKADGPMSLMAIPSDNKESESPDEIIEVTENEEKVFENVQTITDDRWWQYLRMHEKEFYLSPHIQKGYSEFSSLLKDKKLSYTLLKSENFMNLYKNDDDPNYTIYKSSILIEGDFYNIVKILQTDTHEKFWNLYLKSIKLAQKVQDMVQVFETRYDQELWNFIFTFDWKYIREAWIKGSHFNLVRMSVDNPNKDYISNLLSLNMPIEMFGIRLKKVEGMFSKNKMVIIVKAKKKKISLLNRIFEKFIKKYLIAFSIIRDQLDELLADIVGQIEAENQPKPKKGNYEETFFEDIPEIRETDADSVVKAPLTVSKNMSKSSRFLGASPQKEVRFEEDKPSSSSKIIVPKQPKHPEILPFLDFKQEHQLEAYKNLKHTLRNLNIELSDEMIRRYLVAREFDLETCMKEINLYQLKEWIKNNDVSRLSLSNPMFVSYINPPIWKEIGYDREGRPIAVLNLSYYYPEKTPYEDFRKYIALSLYEMKKKFKPGVGQFYLIIDLTEVKSENLSLTQSKETLKVLQTFFPAYSLKIFLVNMGFVFRSLYYAVQGFLKPRVKQRLVICNSANNEVYKRMSEFFDDDNIPVKFGGRNSNY